MRRGFLGSLAALCLGAGAALAQQLPAPRPLESSFSSPSLPQEKMAASPHWTMESGSSTTAPYLLCGPRPYAGAGPACDHPSVSCNEEEIPATSIWARAEYLLWWIKDAPLSVPLVTTSSPGSLGVLGNSDTAVLFGDSEIEYRAFSGARFTLRLWADSYQTCGFEASVFFLEKHPVTFSPASTTTGVPLLARPFVNPLTGAESSLLVSAPDQFTGSVAVRSASSLYGWEANLLGNLTRRGGVSVDLLAGFRYVHFQEDLTIGQSSTLLPGGTTGFEGQVIVPPATIGVFDSFVTRNDFYGGQLGARAEYLRGRVFVQLQGKVALGSTHEVAFINGASSLAVPGNPTVIVPGGLLAVSSNSGRAVHDDFSVVPEVAIKIGYELSRHLRAYDGYAFL